MSQNQNPFIPSNPGAVTSPISNAGRARADRQTADSTPTSRAAVAVACTNCRSRHLKCDGQQPCSRCVQEVLAECSYMKSRRGWKGPRTQDSVGAYSRISSVSVPTIQGLSPNTHLSSLSPTLDSSVLENTGLNTETLSSPNTGFSLELLMPVESRGQLIIAPPPAAQLPVDTSTSGLFSAFYSFFFPGHPFVLPATQMLDLLRKLPLNHLHLALQFIGAFYVVGANTSMCEANLRHLLATYGGPKDHFFVQTLVLYAVGLHMSDKEDESTQALIHAIQLAKDLKMNEPIYASSHGGVNTILEECLRRTWWEIWVLDGMMTGVNHTYSMQLGGIDVSSLQLPSEEAVYNRGETCSLIRTLEHYDDAAFMDGDEDEVYSSSTYRIDAIRVLHKVLAASQDTNNNNEAFDSAETHIMNWSFGLPDIKKRPIDRDGVVDEVLFEAHMIISACSIMLNRPRSDLFTEEIASVRTCVGSGSLTLPSQYKEYHTANSMNAAMNICMLIKLPCPLVKHSPFFTCAITMAAVVYLAYWSFIVTEDRDKVIKEHIRLNIGSLKSMAGVMPIAKTVLRQVKGVAGEIFASKRAIRNAYYSHVTREQILDGMIEEINQTAHAGSGFYFAVPH